MALILAAAKSSGLGAQDLAYDAVQHQLFALIDVPVKGAWRRPGDAKLVALLFHPKARLGEKDAKSLLGVASNRDLALRPCGASASGELEYRACEVLAALDECPRGRSSRPMRDGFLDLGGASDV